MSQRTTAGGRRRLSRTPVKATVDRRELIEAIAAVAGILVVTALLIWGMRPGGLLGRQPRVVLWLVIVAVVFTVAVRMLALPGRRFGDDPRVGWGIAAGIAGVVALVLGFLWPSGLVVRDSEPQVFIPGVDGVPIDTGGQSPFGDGIPSDGGITPEGESPVETPTEEAPAETPVEDSQVDDTGAAPTPEG